MDKNVAFAGVAAAVSDIRLGINTPIPLFTVDQSVWQLATGMPTVVYAVCTLGASSAPFL